MSRKTYSPGAQRMHRLLHELFRGSDWKTILAAVVFLALMQWAATDAYEMSHAFLKANAPTWILPAAGWISITLLFVYIWSWRRFASAAAGGKLDIRVEAPAMPCKGLVVFLSLIRNQPNGPDSDEVVDTLGGPTEEDSLKSESVRNYLKGPWRMPVEAIAHHIETLQYVTVIHSAGPENTNEAGPVKARPTDRFRALIRRLTAYRAKPPEVISVSPDHAGDGINFNDPSQVLAAIEAAKKILLDVKGLRPEEIVIDITSGTKIATGIAAASAFDDKVRFQYVDFNRDTLIYSVAAYDLSYVPYGK